MTPAKNPRFAYMLAYRPEPANSLCGSCGYAAPACAGANPETASEKFSEANAAPACAGAMLREMEKNPGGRPPDNHLQPASGLPPALADLGINYTASHRWQVMGWERLTGAMLRDMPMQGPGEYQRLQPATVAPTLSDLGIEKTASHRWQTMAGRRDARSDCRRRWRVADRARHGGGVNPCKARHLSDRLPLYGRWSNPAAAAFTSSPRRS